MTIGYPSASGHLWNLSFMPYDLLAVIKPFSGGKGNITPPKDWGRWDWFIEQ